LAVHAPNSLTSELLVKLLPRKKRPIDIVTDDQKTQKEERSTGIKTDENGQVVYPDVPHVVIAIGFLELLQADRRPTLRKVKVAVDLADRHADGAVADKRADAEKIG
jgi:hypothetical protein